MFVSRFVPEVPDNDITTYINQEIKWLNQISNAFLLVFWPFGCIISVFYGKLHDKQLFAPDSNTQDETVQSKEAAGGAEKTP
ncbi:hypothetical protein PR048_018254 [Dryococelus australis]|uniref:Transmembrane protein n=1 Tax=Dryococelus australis TaxID=614101 RepID=A0ABQ9HCH0_9NEOP|nr:hypothetical protein PR048_018254 [Dryococelus australis]